ncbi:hypothetical protein YC2023_110919 [Brassica napus]
MCGGGGGGGGVNCIGTIPTSQIEGFEILMGALVFKETTIDSKGLLVLHCIKPGCRTLFWLVVVSSSPSLMSGPSVSIVWLDFDENRSNKAAHICVDHPFLGKRLEMEAFQLRDEFPPLAISKLDMPTLIPSYRFDPQLKSQNVRVGIIESKDVQTLPLGICACVSVPLLLILDEN